MWDWSGDLYDEYFKKKKRRNGHISINPLQDGDDAMRNFCQVLMSVPGYYPMDFQIEILSIFGKMALSTIYYKYWAKYQREIKEQYGNLRIPIIGSTKASRRDGKSTAFQLVIAALLLCAPPRTDYCYGIGIVSNNLAGSKKMIEDIIDLFNKMDTSHVKISSTATKIFVEHKNGINKLFAFTTKNVSYF